MKQALLLSFFAVILMSCQKQNAKHSIQHSSDIITIDGKSNDRAWSKTKWHPIDQKWLGEEFSNQDFSGRFKILWDENFLYVLAEIQDDTLIDLHPNGLVNYWDDDCLEVFVDEDASGGNHQYNYNAFAYHISLDGKVVDIGKDSIAHYYDHIKVERITNESISIWELSIDLYKNDFSFSSINQKSVLKSQKEIGFAIAYCDNDHSSQRENFIGSVQVEGEDKNRGWIDADVFQKFRLIK